MLSILTERYQADWFVLLSGSDYPVRRADELRSEFASTAFDAYMDHREIRADFETAGLPDVGYERPAWRTLAYKRYCASRVWWPQPSRKLHIGGILPFRRKYFLINQNIDVLLQLT
jgi:hypothetical protein